VKVEALFVTLIVWVSAKTPVTAPSALEVMLLSIVKAAGS